MMVEKGLSFISSSLLEIIFHRGKELDLKELRAVSLKGEKLSNLRVGVFPSTLLILLSLAVESFV
jgi:hypothetical protein